MPGCSVPNCHRRADKGYRLFVFPKKPERRKLWTELCNRVDKPPPKHARMCEFHFDDNQFEKDSNGKKGKLKPNAIPTFFDVTIDFKRAKEDILINVNNLSFEENFKNRTKGFNREKENFQDLNISVEHLCVKSEISDDTLSSIIKSENIVESENNNVQPITDRTKDLEEQLKVRDKELVKTQQLLLETLKQNEKLRTQNGKLQTRISDLRDIFHKYNV